MSVTPFSAVRARVVRGAPASMMPSRGDPGALPPPAAHNMVASASTRFSGLTLHPAHNPLLFRNGPIGVSSDDIPFADIAAASPAYASFVPGSLPPGYRPLHSDAQVFAPGNPFEPARITATAAMANGNPQMARLSALRHAPNVGRVPVSRAQFQPHSSEHMWTAADEQTRTDAIDAREADRLNANASGTPTVQLPPGSSSEWEATFEPAEESQAFASPPAQPTTNRETNANVGNAASELARLRRQNDELSQQMLKMQESLQTLQMGMLHPTQRRVDPTPPALRDMFTTAELTSMRLDMNPTNLPAWLSRYLPVIAQRYEPFAMIINADYDAYCALVSTPPHAQQFIDSDRLLARVILACMPEANESNPFVILFGEAMQADTSCIACSLRACQSVRGKSPTSSPLLPTADLRASFDERPGA